MDWEITTSNDEPPRQPLGQFQVGVDAEADATSVTSLVDKDSPRTLVRDVPPNNAATALPKLRALHLEDHHGQLLDPYAAEHERSYDSDVDFPGLSLHPDTSQTTLPRLFS